jgi:sulfur relay (sulfurtransferase) complex TusBCD TusD component (DsrE family)
MHFVISATYGPTDPTRAMLPFIFAASAVQSGDQVTLMLFADSVLVAVEGAGANVTLMVCKPCVDARGLSPAVLDKRIKPAGMNEFHAAAKQSDARVVNFYYRRT